MILLSSHSPEWNPDHAMRAARGDPRGGWNPMRKIRHFPPERFPFSGVPWANMDIETKHRRKLKLLFQFTVGFTLMRFCVNSGGLYQ